MDILPPIDNAQALNNYARSFYEKRSSISSQNSNLINEAPKIILDSLRKTSSKMLQNNELNKEKLIQNNRYKNLSKKKEKKDRKTDSKDKKDGLKKCIPIKGIYLQGVSLLDKKELLSIKQLDEKCISENDLNNYIQDLSLLYVNKGYISTRVLFISPNNENKLGLRVVEGFIEDIVDDSKTINLSLLFKSLKNEKLNLRDLEQALDQANRLSSNNLTLDIIPGNKFGSSIIKLKNIKTNTKAFSLSLSNQGQESTGRVLFQGSSTIEDALTLSDFLSLSISSTLNKNNTSKYSRNYSLFYSLPYLYYTLSTYASYSHYLYEYDLTYNRVELKGDTKQISFKLDKVFYRNQYLVNTLFTQFTYKNVNNYFQESKLEISSPTLSIFEFGLSHLAYYDTSVLSINASVEVGTSLFKKKKIENNPIEEEFKKLKLNIYYNKNFSNNYNLSSSFTAQYSNDILPGVEYLSISDTSSVRGFDKTSLSSEKAWYLHNDFSKNLFFSNSVLTLGTSFDYGQIIEEKKKAYSFGIFSKYRNKSFTFDLSLAKAYLINRTYEKNENCYFLTKITYNF